MNQYHIKHHANAGRIAVAATLAGLLSFGMAMPSIAYADTTTTKSYTWADGEQQPTASQTITENGKTYTLKSTSTPKKSGSDQTLTQDFTTTQTGTSADVNNVQAAVPTSVPYSSDGYSGTLNRTHIDYTPIYVENTRTDTGTRSGKVSGSADAHPDDSLAGSSTINQNGHTLNRTSVTWTKADGDSQSTLWNYTANYSGTYTTKDFDHYNVTGYYSGTLSKTVSNGTWSMTATYTAPDDNTNQNDAGDTQTINDNADNQNQDSADNANADNADENAENQNDETLEDNLNENDNENASGYEMQNTNSSNTNANSNSSKQASAGILGAVQKHPLLLLIPVILIVAIVAAIVAAAKKKKKGAAVVAAAIPTNIYGLNSELIEFVTDGSNTQHVLATGETYLSPDKDTPTLVEIPQPPIEFTRAAAIDADGNAVEDEDGNPMMDDYYLAISDVSYDAVSTGTTDDNGSITFAGIPSGSYMISVQDGPAQPVFVDDGQTQEVTVIDDMQPSDLDTDNILRDNVDEVHGDSNIAITLTDASGNPIANQTVDLLDNQMLSRAVSNRLVIESNNHVIYDGDLASQIKLDPDLLADALNDTAEDDITEDVDRWMTTYEDYDDNRSDMIQQENVHLAEEQAKAEQQAAAQQQAAQQRQADSTQSDDDANDYSMNTDTSDDPDSMSFDDLSRNYSESDDDSDDYDMDDDDTQNPDETLSFR